MIESDSRVDGGLIRETLIRIGAISDGQIELLSKKTRDNPNLNVYRDIISGVIFIDNYYIGDDEYKSGEYRKNLQLHERLMGADYEDTIEVREGINPIDT